MRTLIGLFMAVFLAFAPGAYAQAAGRIDALRAKAAAGDAEAQYSLGHMYNLGVGIQGDEVKARKWFLLSAKQGNAKAQDSVGLMYFMGRGGVTQDYAEARKWSLLAAEQDNARAQAVLGLIYKRGGGGVPQNYVEAYKWLNLAARTFGYNSLRDKLAAKMTLAQIAKGQKLTGEWIAAHPK